MTRYAFISRLGSVAYVAVTYDENGSNLPIEIDGNKVEWSRIEASHGEIFLLVSTADMERDLHEAGIHIRETRDEIAHRVQYSYSCGTLTSPLVADRLSRRTTGVTGAIGVSGMSRTGMSEPCCSRGTQV